MSDIHEDLRVSIFTPPPTPEQQHRAALAVCTYTDDRAVARELLDMLGLLPDGETVA